MKYNIEEDVVEHLLKEITEICLYNNGMCYATNDYFVGNLNRKYHHGLIKKDITSMMKILRDQGRIIVIPGQNRMISIIKDKITSE